MRSRSFFPPLLAASLLLVPATGSDSGAPRSVAARSGNVRVVAERPSVSIARDGKGQFGGGIYHLPVFNQETTICPLSD